MTGVQAVAEPEDQVETEALVAIESTVGAVLDTAVPVTEADTVVVTGDGTTVELSSDAGAGVSLTGADDTVVEIGLPFASEADTAAVIDGTVVYDNNNGSTTTPLVHEDGSVPILTTIADASAPTEYAYEFPEGTQFETLDDGSVMVLQDVDGTPEVTGTIAPAWALDANGTPVSTHFEMRDAALIQIVDHQASVTAYPVVADPKYYWWGFSFTWSNADVAKVLLAMETGIGVAGIAAIMCNGTVAGAIPCTVAYGVAAALVGMGAAGLTYCNRNGRGTVIRWGWAGGFAGCSAR